MNPDLTPDQLAAIRKGIRAATAAGMPTAKLDAYLKQTYGLTSADAMKPTGRDADRAMAQGLTLGHADELYGLYKKLTGGDYTTARDQVRTNDAEARAANPWTMGITSAIGGAGPAAAASMIPGMAPVAGATLANAGRGALMGAGLGAVSGEGNSTASTMGGMAGDAAIGGVVGGVLGGAGGAAASKLAGKGLPGGNAGVVSREAATVLPLDPKQAVATMTRQETLAPGSVVLADASPEMQSLVRGVGADPKVAIEARSAAADRLKALTQARKTVGQNYDLLAGRTEPVDPEIVAAIANSGIKGVLKGPQKDVDLSKVLDARSQLLAAARSSRNAYVQKQKGDAAQMLTDWLAKKDPTIAQLDADYAFLTARRTAAKETLRAITSSMAQHAAGRAYDVEPASVGAALPVTVRGVPGAMWQVAKNAMGSSKAARAKAVADLLLTPQRDATGFARLTQLHDLVLNPPQVSGLPSSLLAGVVAPQTGGALVRGMQP